MSEAVQNWDHEVDLLVVGAGPGGMTAALVAAIDGLDVLICEKSEMVGGTGATSAGTLWIPGNSDGVAAGYDDSADDARDYLNALIGGDGIDPRCEAFIQEGATIIDKLVEKTALEFGSCGHHPDYRNNLPGAGSKGRAIIPKPFDGRKLGGNFHRVRPPIDDYLLFGGMMAGKADINYLLGRYKSLSNLFHSVRLILRYAIDRFRYKRGTRLVMGNALVAQLYYSLIQNGVPIKFGADFKELIVQNSLVNGAQITIGDSSLHIGVRRGVVLATGGFAHNEVYRKSFMPDPTPRHSMAVAENTGDGLAAAERVGAELRDGSHEMGGLWSPVSVTRKADGSTGLYPHILLDRAKPGLIAVNGGGRRFVNEGVSYHDFVEAMFRADETAPTIPAWLICDAQFVRKYGLGAIHPETRDVTKYEQCGYLFCAKTIRALSHKIQIDGEILTETVERHNTYAETGSDLEFGKGDTELNRVNGDPGNKPNPCLAPIVSPPFVALKVWPGEIACSSGINTDEHARVLDVNGQTINGLYACGNDMASVMQGHYPGPGTTLGPALVFGYRAAKHAAGS